MQELLKPRWLVGHVLVLGVCALMVSLGFWQLDRLDERRQQNERVAAVSEAQPFEIVNASFRPLLEFSPVVVTGTWDPQHTVYLRYPIRDGIQGYEVLMPLRTEGGSVLVNRGFIPVEEGRNASAPDVAAAVVSTVEGRVRNWESGGTLGFNTGDPPIPTVENVDKAQVESATGMAFGSQWVELSSPAGEGDPLPNKAPEISEGSHFAYALQWFGFTAVVLAGWTVLCVRTARPEATLKP